MPERDEFILGEFQRTLDERYRLAIPVELLPGLGDGANCILAKERPGCLSLWRSEVWQTRLDAGVGLIRAKMQAGKLEGQLAQVQRLGRLLSTRHRTVELAGRGRLLVPEGFREFLRVQPNSEVVVVGAAVCIEIWNPTEWLKYLDAGMVKFRNLFDRSVHVRKTI
jgi:MraZ protein